MPTGTRIMRPVEGVQRTKHRDSMADVGPIDRAIVRQIVDAREDQGLSMAQLFYRLEVRTSPDAYRNFEKCTRIIRFELLADICRVLGLRLHEVVARAERMVDAQQADPSEVVGVDLLSGPTLPAIRVRVSHLLTRQEPWLDAVRGMFKLHAAQHADRSGDLLIEEPLVRAISAQAGIDGLTCWQLLAQSIVFESDRATSTAS